MTFRVSTATAQAPVEPHHLVSWRHGLGATQMSMAFAVPGFAVYGPHVFVIAPGTDCTALQSVSATEGRQNLCHGGRGESRYCSTMLQWC